MATADQHEGLRNAVRARRLRNNVKRLREDRLLSKAELARKAGVSPMTIDRVESGQPCRMNTKRKIILALGMRIEDKDQVFVPEPAAGDGSDYGPGASRTSAQETQVVQQHEGSTHGKE